jgi:hypothetical protein
MRQRELYYFPIVHSQSDMGSLSESVRKIALEQIGERAWRQKVRLIERFWRGIEDAIESLSLSCAQTRIYQDGLPVCRTTDDEMRIVDEAARMGSVNYQLLVRLRQKGATIMGTESAELLVEEYMHIKKSVESGHAAGAVTIEAAQIEASDLLLAKRDTFIAHRIAATLKPGDSGILLIGTLHDVASRLPADIQVQYPISRPSFTTHVASATPRGIRDA